jgi:hypothetical protein
MVLNVSKSGLFIQTSAAPAPGTAVVIDLDVASGEESVPLQGRVVWRRMVASQLRSISQGGVGIRIESAPEAYERFILAVAGDDSSSASSADAETAGPELASEPDSSGAASEPDTAEPASDSESAGLEFRVRVKQEGGMRTRMMTIQSLSEEEARSGALEIVGPGWAILEVKSTFE